MKNYFLIIAASLFCFKVSAQDVTGHWRGVLELAPQYRIVLGLRITNEEQGYQLSMLSPNQSLKEMIPGQFKLDGNHLSFSDMALKASFSGTFDGEKLTGTFTQQRQHEVSLTRLSEKDMQRLEHEQQWFGDLQISKNSVLPLVLNVAVVAGGYHITLDSPKQESFGIPVNEFTLSDTQLRFSSSLINAAYSAVWVKDRWQGTFVQGMAMPLDFKKN
jgi:hypothetical protein